jgi:hypothetical protein
MQLLTGTDFQSFIEAKKAAVVPLDAEWDVAYRPVLRRRILEAEEVLADQVNFGEVDCELILILQSPFPFQTCRQWCITETANLSPH